MINLHEFFILLVLHHSSLLEPSIERLLHIQHVDLGENTVEHYHVYQGAQQARGHCQSAHRLFFVRSHGLCQGQDLRCHRGVLRLRRLLALRLVGCLHQRGEKYR
jgi:hypothetical protein